MAKPTPTQAQREALRLTSARTRAAARATVAVGLAGHDLVARRPRHRDYPGTVPRTLCCMRALLVVNPKATATTPAAATSCASALASDLKLDVVETTHRGHATELAAGAVDDEIDLVVALGGDGTVNEVVNGLLTTTPSTVPALAVVPGGSTNVFARGLGIPSDPVEATGALLEALRAGRTPADRAGPVNDRLVHVLRRPRLRRRGDRDGREAPARGQPPPPPASTSATPSHTSSATRRPHLACDARGRRVARRACRWWWCPTPRPGPTGRPAAAAVPAGVLRHRARPVRPGQDAAVPTLRALRPDARPPATMVRTAAASRLAHDLASLLLTAETPAALQVDGDYVGEFNRFELGERAGRSDRGRLTRRAGRGFAPLS